MSNSAPIGDSYFLSYSRADEQVALKFATDLRQAGIAMWVDQLDIRPSEHWDRAIERAVRGCRGLVVMLSPRSTASDNVADEISFAIDHGKSVLPVMIERCSLPLRITRMQVVDATQDYERALQQCVAELGPRPEASPGSGMSEKSEPLPSSTGFDDPEVIASAKARLTPVLGPIAQLVVDKEAMRANSPGELYQLLAQHIENEKDKELFLKTGGSVPSAKSFAPNKNNERARQSVPAAEVDRLTAILTHYLGPMATVVVRRESKNASSAAELKEKLASRIAHESERADFLMRANAR